MIEQGGAGAVKSIRIGERSFPPDRPVTIGRDPSADVVVDHPRVSRRHATLEFRDGAWVFRDAGSSNGSLHGGARIGELRVDGPTEVWLGLPNDGAPLLLEPMAPAVSRAPATPDPRHGLGDAGQIGSMGRLSAVHALGSSEVRIGRAPDNDVVIDDLRASRYHALVRRLATERFELHDLDSHNGTFLNHRRVSGAALGDGDVVTIAGHSFRFRAGRLEEYQDLGATWLAASDISVLADGRALLHDVALAVPPSTLVALAGPSGSGKTTLINALSGRRPPDRGQVWYAGQAIYSALDDMSQRIGYVPQTDILHGELSVRRALLYAAELRFPDDVSRSERTQRVDEVMRELGLEGRADLPVERLSGGQRKRVSVGLELLTRPSLLFLDEPTSGLDPANEATVVALLNELAQGGRIIVVATHSIETIRRSDRVLFMAAGGHLSYFGPPEGALGYFDEHGAGDDFAGIFRTLADGDGSRWATAFRNHQSYQSQIRAPIAEADLTSAAPPPSAHRPARRSAIRQFGVLVRRYVAVLLADRRNLVLIALQAPFFGLLIMLLLGPDRLNAANGPEATMLAWLLVIAATWLGTSNAIREIVKERPILDRERATGLSVGAYVLSKALVLGVITAIQVAVMVPIALALQVTPGAAGNELGSAPAAALGSTHLELIIGVTLAGLAAMTLALLVSAIVRRPDKAATLLPFLLIAHTLLSQPFFDARNPAIQAAGRISSAYWGVAATAATLDLNRIRSDYLLVIAAYRDAGGELVPSEATAERCRFDGELEPFETCPDRHRREGGFDARADWVQSQVTWAISIAILIAMTAAWTLGAWLVLRLQALRGGSAETPPQRGRVMAPTPARNRAE
jgi:ABC-type multidrug transport system ATPase subunit